MYSTLLTLMLQLTLTVLTLENDTHKQSRRATTTDTFGNDTTFHSVFGHHRLLELQDLKTYQGAWYRLPRNFDFDPIPPIYAEFLKTMNPNHFESVRIQIEKENNQRIFNKTEYLTLLLRYALCYNKTNPYRNCPNPCNGNPCHDKKLQYSQKICDSHYNDIIVINDSRQDLQEFIKIFQISYTCRCEYSHTWSIKNRMCVEANNCVKNNPCYFGGSCFYGHKNTTFCVCLPAFTGPLCEVALSICETNKNFCGSHFKCTRSPSNVRYGYECECGVSFEPFSKDIPFCVNRDECVNNPCLHKKSCIDLYGDYKCLCGEEFTGKNCEFNMSTMYNLKLWEPWGPWSKCSLTCGENNAGLQESSRKCPVGAFPGACGNGTDKRVRHCEPAILPCPKITNRLVLENLGTAAFDDFYLDPSITRKPKNFIHITKKGHMNMSKFIIEKFNNLFIDATKIENKANSTKMSNVIALIAKIVCFYFILY